MGTGGEYQRGSFDGFEPKLSGDVWRNQDRSRGARVELATTWSRSSTDGLVLTLAVGAKTRGYLLGHQMGPGPYLNLGAGVRF